MMLFLMLALGSSPVRCNLNALSADERAAHSRAFADLLPTFTDRKELADGYRLSGPAVSAPLLAEWIARERRCCPSLRFRIEMAPEQGPVTVTIRGPKGTRELLRGSFRLWDCYAGGLQGASKHE